MATYKRPFLDFYTAEQIIPTSQAIINPSKYRNHRAHLFRQLGIPLAWLQGKSIFELGPGNAQKAEFLLQYRPAVYVAVDGNPTSVAQTKDRLAVYQSDTTIEVLEADFDTFNDSRRYDFVIAEAVIPTQIDPGIFLQRLRRLMRPGGVLVFTCMDHGSLLSEMLRRAIAHEQLDRTFSLMAQANILHDFFRADLDALEGMTRLPHDWVIDQLIHPWIGPLLDIPTALELLGESADFLGSSPNFLQDWRWYKSPEVLGSTCDPVKDAYWRSAHNLLDKRVHLPNREPDLNRGLFATALSLYSIIMNNQYASLADLTELTRDIRTQLPTGAEATRDSIQAFEAFARTGRESQLESMRSWWGRGQQYVSVIAEDV